jgi:yecA family protein
VIGKTTLTHAELDQQLHAADADCGAAESHGMLCGIICAAGNADEKLWLEQILGEGNTLSAAAQKARDLLERLYAESRLQLEEDGLDLVLLLPEDDILLHHRSRALGRWCQGFLYGLAVGGIRGNRKPADNVDEIMHDFYEISNAGFNAAASDENEEAAYLEIVEYVRMSVLVCHHELQPPPAAERLH